MCRKNFTLAVGFLAGAAGVLLGLLLPGTFWDILAALILAVVGFLLLGR